MTKAEQILECFSLLDEGLQGAITSSKRKAVKKFKSAAKMKNFTRDKLKAIAKRATIKPGLQTKHREPKTVDII